MNPSQVDAVIQNGVSGASVVRDDRFVEAHPGHVEVGAPDPEFADMRIHGVQIEPHGTEEGDGRGLIVIDLLAFYDPDAGQLLQDIKSSKGSRKHMMKSNFTSYRSCVLTYYLDLGRLGFKHIFIVLCPFFYGPRHV